MSRRPAARSPDTKRAAAPGRCGWEGGRRRDGMVCGISLLPAAPEVKPEADRQPEAFAVAMP